MPKNSSDSNTNPELIKYCPICSNTSDGNHFGIDSCRACAAFFRRSIVDGKKYHCRLARNSCEVSKAMKSMCRRCRLAKCLAAGMHPEHVREPLNIQPFLRKYSFLPSTSQVQLPINRENVVSVDTSDCDPQLLTKMFQEYTQLCSIRRATELALTGGSIARIFSNEDLFPGFIEGNFIDVSLFYRAHIPAQGDFVSNCFPEFNELHPDEKWIIFRSFVIHSWSMDNQYRTCKHIPLHMQERYCCISETSYIDMQNVNEFFRNAKESSRKEMERLLPTCLNPAITCMAKPMLDMKMENEEYAFILAILLWQNDCDKTNTNVYNLCARMRDKVYNSLEAYYKLDGRTNIVARVGALHNIHCGLLNSVARMREYNELFDLVEAYESDPFIRDFIKT